MPPLRPSAWAAALLLMCLSADRAIPQSVDTNQLLYDDALANGWRLVGQAPVVLDSTSTVRTGGRAIRARLNAFQLINLRHDPFDTRIYTALTFWIHGGSSGGQRLRVNATVNDVQQPAVDLPILGAGTWQRISVPLERLGIAGRQNVTGIWIRDASGVQVPEFFVDDMTLTILPPPATVRLDVNADDVVRVANPGHFGLHTAAWDPILDSEATLDVLRETGIQALRFPGGSWGNDFHWASNTAVARGTCTGGTPQRTSFDRFARIATSIGAEVFIIANYGSGTPAEAAAWVRYSAAQGYPFRYWEVGNENYGSWETDCTGRPHDPYTYAMRFADYYQQMKAADPDIRVGAVSIPGEGAFANYTDHPATNPRTRVVHNGWTPVVLATLRSLGVTPDFIVHHRYDQNPGSESDADVLQSSSLWAADAADLRQQLSDYLGEAGAAVEIHGTENNSVSSRPGKQSTSIVNGLFLADSVGRLLQTEVVSLVWHNLRQAREHTNNNGPWLTGWRQYGNYGIVSIDFSNPSAPAERYPTFYVTKLLRHFARGGDRIVRAASDYPLLSIYATRRTDGSLTLLVVNKHPAWSLRARMALTGFDPAAYAAGYSYGAREDEAARTGAGSGDLRAFSTMDASAEFEYVFPPYSASVLILTPRDGGPAAGGGVSFTFPRAARTRRPASSGCRTRRPRSGSGVRSRRGC